MAAAMNGLALHGGFIPFGGTFLVFADYARPAIRLAALMGTRVIHVMTHDSIGLGEDGPTHQPVEHLASLRAIPNLTGVPPLPMRWRRRKPGLRPWPADEADPSVLCLTRQGLPGLRDHHVAENLVARGAYVLREVADTRRRDFAGDRLGGFARPRSRRPPGPRRPARRRRLRCPAGSSSSASPRPTAPRCWAAARASASKRRPATTGTRWITPEGGFVGMTGFGASAPAEQLYQHFGITAEAVAAAAQQLVR